MQFKKLMLSCAAAAILAGTPAAWAMDDAAIDAAATEYRTLFNNAREAGERPGQADMGDYVDKVLANFDFKEMTLDQIQAVLEKLPVAYSTKTAPALDAHLVKLAEAKDAAGARAAILRLQLLHGMAKPEDKLAIMQPALAHPAIADAFAEGYGGNILMSAVGLGPDGLKAIQPKLVELAGSVRFSAPVNFFHSSALFMLSAAKTLDSEAVKGYAPFREAVAKAGEEKLKGQLTDPEKEKLSDALARLNGAYARGELIGHPAPDIEFLWYRDGSDTPKEIKSLADLKGKVVVLDFWATWCGPCVASFPKVKALSRYYRGYDVVVVGVTSPQGAVILNNSRVETKDLQKEIELTQQFLTEKEVTWPIAISKQKVFNPDFGVTGIPSVAIIDTNGVVRHAGLHPASPLDEKTPLIDKLLSEAKLPVPALLMVPKAPAAAN